MNKFEISVMYAAQLYRAVLPFLFVPIFLKALGAGAYSIVSFYLTMVALLGLLDIGFSSAIIKIFSGSSHSDIKRLEAFHIFRKFILFVSLSSLGIILFFYFFQSHIAYGWLKQDYRAAYSADAVFLLGVAIGLTYLKQFLICFFTAVERHLLVAKFNVISPTLCYVGGYYFMKEPADLPKYFTVLSVVSLVEVALLSTMIFKVYKKFVATVSVGKVISTDIILFFKSTMLLGAVSMLWVVVSQSDKLFASRFMAPEDFTFYQIGSQLAGVIAIISVPLIQYLMPRVNRSRAEGTLSEYVSVFFVPFFFFIFIAWNIGAAIFVNGQMFLSFWLAGDDHIAGVAAHAKYLFLASLFSAAMQFIFLIIFSFNMITEHLKVYMLYSVVAVAGTFFIAVLSPQNIGVWCFLHAALFSLAWGRTVLARYFSGFNWLLSFLFIIVPILLFTLEYWLAYAGFTQNPLSYFAVRIAVFALSVFALLRLVKIFVLRVAVK